MGTRRKSLIQTGTGGNLTMQETKTASISALRSYLSGMTANVDRKDQVKDQTLLYAKNSNLLKFGCVYAYTLFTAYLYQVFNVQTFFQPSISNNAMSII